LFNPWHDLSLGENFPHEFDALIEIPYGSRVKYEMDKDSGLIRVDRILHSAVYYPANYGLIPGTYCEDGDPMDVFVFGEDPIFPGVVARIRPVGILRMVDGGEKDDKILAVLAKDPLFSLYRHVEDVPPHLLKKIERFLEDYKILENKSVKVNGIEGNAEAKKALLESRESYLKNRDALIRKT
jgi:inorganic pyrophosphatase